MSPVVVSSTAGDFILNHKMLMKKNYCFAILLLAPFLLYAQKHDNNWIFGTSSNPYNNPNGVLMHFEQGYPTFSLENIRQYYGLYCAICSDSSGNLLFHTNGRAIRNKVHQIMENGNVINPGTIWEQYLFGYPSLTGGFAIPAPGYSNRYYLIHTSANNDNEPFPAFPVLYSSTIDMNANGGLGKVISKNDTLAVGDIPSPVAIKHGNGRDWWIIVGDYQNDKYQTYLVDPSGIHFVFDQIITPAAFSSTSGYHSASPDGRFFVNNDDVSGLWIYDFDRCSGLLSHPRLLPYQPPVFWTSTNVFSPDTRFLYVGTHLVVYQLDMETIDEPVIAFDTIARYEYGASPSPPYYTHFMAPELAPDAKIYYTTFNETNAYHVLNRPKSPLLAADFSQRGLTIPKRRDGTRCYFPSYRLGRSLNAPCDTLPYAGTQEEYFTHVPYKSAKTTRSVEEIQILHLPPTFHLPNHVPDSPPENPLSPVRMQESQKKIQQQKSRSNDPKK